MLSRWRPLPYLAGQPMGHSPREWTVQSEAGALAPEPHTFPTYGAALKRSDALNESEQRAIAIASARGLA